MEKALYTKILLGKSFRDLLQKKSFAKVIVSDISERAGMSRKSFYYHFKDKYEVVNWLFDWEFEEILEGSDARGWDVLEKLIFYIDSQRSYYGQLLRITGQNCFSEHLVAYVRGILQEQGCLSQSNDFCCDIAADAFVAAMKRWLFQYGELSASQVSEMLKALYVSVQQG